MKTTKYMVMAAAAMAFAACSNEENVSDGPVEARVSASFGVESRAVNTNNKWVKDVDAIGISVIGSTKSDSGTDRYQNVKYTAKSSAASSDFSPEKGAGVFFQDAEEEVTFSAYYPYNKDVTKASPTINVNTKDNNTDEKQATIDYLFASGATASKGTPQVLFTGDENQFKHCMAQLNLKIVASISDGFTAEEAKAIISSTSTYNLGGLIHAGTFDVSKDVSTHTTVTGTAVDDWNITNLVHSDDESAYTRTYTLILLPQNVSAKPLAFTAVVGEQTYKNIANINPNLEAGKKYTYTLTIKKSGIEVSGCTIADWGKGTEGSGDAKM